MAEPTCVIHPLISYSIPEETQVCNYGEEEEEEEEEEGGSVSFGRFMSENLGWERWSSFNSNRNRYVEEAEMYSRPGSVAQKKLYFEAHFKRMAALKAAALLETGIGTDTGVDTTIDDVKDSGVNVESVEVHEGGSNECVEGFVVHQNELYSEVLSSNEEDLGEILGGKSEVLKEEEEEDRMESNVKLSENVIPQMEKPSMQQKTSLKEEVSTQQQQQLPKSVPLLQGVEEVSTQQQQLPKSVPLLHGVEEVSTQQQQQQLPKSVPLLQGVEEVSTQQLPEKVPVLQGVEQISTPIVKKNPPLSSFMSPLIHPGKENYATPVKNKSSSIIPDQDHKKRTPLRASINREFNRIISPVIRKIGSSSSNRTPSKGSENGPPLTPDTTKRGARTPRSRLDSSACEKKPTGPRWHTLSESISGGFKSPRSNKNKTSSPIIPTSFCLGSGERATRRKQNLEDKFNATTTEKVQPPSKFKEKAEAELNKFRQSFCFKVMASPDHYRQGELHYKNKSTHQESPKRLGKQQSTSSTSQSRSSLPPRRPTVKPSSLKTVTERNSISNK